MWMFVSGAEQRRREQPDLYRKLLDGPQDEQLVELIKIGLSPSTLFGEIIFRSQM